MQQQQLLDYIIRPIAAFCILIAFAAPAAIPEVANLPQSVSRAPHLSSSFRIIQAAGQSANFLASGKKQITFLAPSDASCANVPELNRKYIDRGWAKIFVLSHTFYGQINVVRLNGGGQLKLNLVTDGNLVNSITEGDALKVRNFLGRYIDISIKNGLIFIGNTVHIRPNSLFVSSTGSVGVIDSCHSL